MKKHVSPGANLKEVFVKGIVLGPGHSRPVLIMKGDQEEDIFPVWLSNMEFDNMEQSNLGVLKSSFFHATSVKVLKSLGLKVGTCIFVEVVGHHQYVDLKVVNEGGDTVQSIRSVAEDCISFCLASNSRFFVTPDIMDRSRIMNSEILAANFDVPNHPYVM
jgi:hypothetical protein